MSDVSKVRQWVEDLKEEMFALVTDVDTYWRLQKNIIQRNPRLASMRSPFFEMLNSAYISATTSALRRLAEKQNRDRTNVSLRIIVEYVRAKPADFDQLLGTTADDDIRLLDEIERNIKDFADRRIAHRDRRGLSSPLPRYGQVRKGVADLAEIFRKYHCSLEGSDLELKIFYIEDFDIFTFAWIEPGRENGSIS